jgi:hypothetical protein
LIDLNIDMDNSLNYADIIENTLKEATKNQPRIQSIRLYPVCVRVSVASANRNSGNFLIMATGWDEKDWINTILFHAYLVVGEASLEEN